MWGSCVFCFVFLFSVLFPMLSVSFTSDVGSCCVFCFVFLFSVLFPMLSVSFTPDVGFLLCILLCFSVLCFAPNVVGVVHPRCGVLVVYFVLFFCSLFCSQSPMWGSCCVFCFVFLFSVLLPMLSVSFTPDVGFLLCILLCFSVLCFVPNVVGVVHPRCGVLVVYFALFFCSLFCSQCCRCRSPLMWGSCCVFCFVFLFSVLFPMLSVSFTPDVGFLCILFCFSVRCFVPNVVGVVHLRCGFLLCILFCFSVLCFAPNVVGVVHP